MKSGLPLTRRLWALLGLLVPLVALFAYTVLRTGPLAATPVTANPVEPRSIAPGIFGIGTVEARFAFQIGPTAAGRVLRVTVDAGDRVRAGQLLAEMDPVDLDDRVAALAAALKNAESQVTAAEAQVKDASATAAYAQAQAARYDALLQEKVGTRETTEAKKTEYQVAAARLAAAQARLESARHETVRIRAESRAISRQRADLRLTAPVDGLVTARKAEPGSTVVAGQSVVEMIDPENVWVNTRFDQLVSSGLRTGLPAQITLRSRAGGALDGQVARVEPLADAVTEETLAKVVFDLTPEDLPPIGELAEVTVMLPALPEAPAVPNAALHRIGDQLGVWLIAKGALRFAPVTTGARDLDGWVQVVDGLETGQRVVVYSQRALDTRSRIEVVDRLAGASS